jgi:hypothetical protein
MESTEGLASQESETRPMYDAIVVFGRGIGKDERGRWHPTPYIEETVDGQHSGVFKTSVNTEGRNAYIGGANANVLAAVQLFEESVREGSRPKLVIFAAGRPDYLKDEASWLSDGKILEDKFKRKIGKSNHQVDTKVIRQNKNTRDDVEQSLKIAKDHGLGRVAIITVGVHIPRSREFYEVAKKEGNVSTDIQVDFISSEEILGRRDRRFTKIFEAGLKTQAYKKTVAKEKEGIKNLRQGRYKFNS